MIDNKVPVLVNFRDIVELWILTLLEWSLEGYWECEKLKIWDGEEKGNEREGVLGGWEGDSLWRNTWSTLENSCDFTSYKVPFVTAVVTKKCHYMCWMNSGA